MVQTAPQSSSLPNKESSNQKDSTAQFTSLDKKKEIDIIKKDIIEMKTNFQNFKNDMATYKEEKDKDISYLKCSAVEKLSNLKKENTNSKKAEDFEEPDDKVLNNIGGNNTVGVTGTSGASGVDMDNIKSVIQKKINENNRITLDQKVDKSEYENLKSNTEEAINKLVKYVSQIIYLEKTTYRLYIRNRF